MKKRTIKQHENIYIHVRKDTLIWTTLPIWIVPAGMIHITSIILLPLLEAVVKIFAGTILTIFGVFICNNIEEMKEIYHPIKIHEVCSSELNFFTKKGDKKK